MQGKILYYYGATYALHFFELFHMKNHDPNQLIHH